MPYSCSEICKLIDQKRFFIFITNHGSCFNFERDHQAFFVNNPSFETIPTFLFRPTCAPHIRCSNRSLLLYIKDHPHFNYSNVSTLLKKSLSETLNSLYPLSGRIKNNLFIDDFEQGASYVEARVKCRMSDFLHHPKLELLKQFVPYQPYELSSEPMALLGIQLNIFDCGSLALGVLAAHKIFDGSTLGLFLQSWVAASQGCHDEEVPHPGLSDGALRFPPNESLLKEFPNSVSGFNEGKGNFIARRFLFDANAIATLKGKAKSKRVENPTRIDALTVFIWKSVEAASKEALLGAFKPLTLAQTVNIRQKMMPSLSSNSIGNLCLLAYAAADDSSNVKTGLDECVISLREAYRKLESSLNIQQGETGQQVISDFLISIEETFKGEKENLIFSSLLNFGFCEADFGWGKPVWVGVVTGITPLLTSSIVLHKANCNTGGIEAWTILPEKIMETLGKNPEFLAFASPNPSVMNPSDHI